MESLEMTKPRTHITIPTQMARDIQELIKYDQRYDNPTEFVKAAAREKLEKLEEAAIEKRKKHLVREIDYT